MDCGVGEPEALFAETVSVDVFVPEFGDRNAVEPGAEDGPGTVDRYKCNHAVAYDAHALCGENAQVLEEDGQLREDESGIVDWNCCPEALLARTIGQKGALRAPGSVLHLPSAA